MDSIWQNLLSVLKTQTNTHTFNIWFKPIRPVKVEEDGSWLLGVPNEFHGDWVFDHYRDVLERTLSQITEKETKIRFVVDERAEKQEAKEPARHSQPKRSKKAPEIGLPLNKALKFNSFVIGESNEFAHAACKAVAQEPGASYNPLFIYGGTGLGKTHLLQAVGHEILRKHKHLRLAYITAERFTSELIKAISTNQMDAFKHRYRDKVDILLMDDIEFIAGKTSTQAEFFHTFNFLFDSGKQIVLTSDQYPHEIKKFEERIRSRLSSGLVADIKPPDIETRMAILNKKAELNGVFLDEDVLRFLANHIRSNVRELQSALIQLKAYSSLTSAKINLDTAREVLTKYFMNRPAGLSSRQIQKKVCGYFNLKMDEMLSKKRARKLVVPRQIAMYLIKRNTELSLKEIGKAFEKDHATVIASIKRIESLMADDMNVRNSVEALEKILESGG